MDPRAATTQIPALIEFHRALTFLAETQDASKLVKWHQVNTPWVKEEQYETMILDYKKTLSEKLYELSYAQNERKQVREWIDLMMKKYKYETRGDFVKFIECMDSDLIAFGNHLTSNAMQTLCDIKVGNWVNLKNI